MRVAQLAASGYFIVSRRHCIASRIDCADWREALALHHMPWDMDRARQWASRPYMGDYYRRILSLDKITLDEGTAEELRRIHNSGRGPDANTFYPIQLEHRARIVRLVA